MLAFPGTLSRPVVSAATWPKVLRKPLVWCAAVLPLVAMLCPTRVGVVFGHSMEPTLKHLSLFAFDQNHYREHPIRKGDIVVIRDGSGTWIKRVYAVGGEGFFAWKEPRDGVIRHEPIAQDQHDYFVQLAADQRRMDVGDCRVVRLKVPKDGLFVIGDGAWSEDSRTWGYVRAENVIGRVVPLPGQDLGTTPTWTEMSSPRAAARLALNH